jgi:hypothetical protein
MANNTSFQIGPSDDNLVQCAYTNFSWVANSGQTVTTPITFEGVIPNGDVVQFQTNDTASWASECLVSGAVC